MVGVGVGGLKGLVLVQLGSSAVCMNTLKDKYNFPSARFLLKSDLTILYMYTLPPVKTRSSKPKRARRRLRCT